MNPKVVLVSLAALLSACSNSPRPEAVSADTIKPTISLSTIAEVQQKGILRLEAQAQDNNAIRQVEFFLDGRSVQVDQTAPYQADVALDAGQNGPHQLKAVATDMAGNQSSAEQTFTVNISQSPVSGDTEAPTIQLILPPSTITQAGNYHIGATATDNVGVTVLQLQIQTPLGSETVDLLSESGNVYTLPVVSNIFNGTYGYTVTAKDAAGNTSFKIGSITVQLP